MGLSRRLFLGATGAGVLGTLVGTGPAVADGHDGDGEGADDHALREVVAVTDPVPENVAFDWNGDLYVGITGGSVRRLPADRTGETDLTVADTELVAEYPGGVAGVLVADGVLYTAVNGETGGVYALDLHAAAAHPRELATLVGPDEQGFVNDLTLDGSRLLVTESFAGVVYEVPLAVLAESDESEGAGTGESDSTDDADGGSDDGEGDACGPSVWLDSDLLDTPSFGANGIATVRGEVFVNVTRVTDTVGRIVRVPVECDGSAGEAEVYVEGPDVFGADGLTSRGAELYAALNSQNRIARVEEGSLTTVFEGGSLSFPSEVVFDPTAPGTAFVCNFSNSAPEQGGVLRGTLPHGEGDETGDDEGDRGEGGGDADGDGGTGRDD